MQELHEENEEKLDIREENEFKKIKLALEHGLDLSSSHTDADLPPEVEGEFLDHIQQWEEQFAQRKTISVYDRAERPAFRPVAEIADEEIGQELDRIMDILSEHSISLGTLCDVEDRELYRFVTEQLFMQEINDIRIPGMMTSFIYEDFCPNHEYDIKNRCTEIMEHITDKRKSDMEPWGLDDEIWLGEKLLSKIELNKKLIDFRDSFSLIEVHKFEYIYITLSDDDTAAEVLAEIDYAGNIDGSSETMDFKGDCRFSLKCKYDWWTINRMEFPGIV